MDSKKKKKSGSLEENSDAFSYKFVFDKERARETRNRIRDASARAFEEAEGEDWKIFCRLFVHAILWINLC